MPLPSHLATRYLQPLREGGSLPAVVDTHDGGMYVVKFRGAGQGPKSLIAELIVGMLARSVGLPVPELTLVEVSPGFGSTEPDPEIQDILRKSEGVNVGLRYLDGAFNFAMAAAGELITPELAADTVWLDSFLTNPDRTARNPNLLVQERRVWLIDHGAALYAHHNWPSVDETRTVSPFPLVRDHVLLASSGDLREADARLAGQLARGVIPEVLDHLPDELLTDATLRDEFPSANAARARYREYLERRLAGRSAFVEEAVAARERALTEPPRRLSARR